MWGWLKRVLGLGEQARECPFPPGDPRREVWEALSEYERRKPEVKKRGLMREPKPVVVKQSEPLERAAYDFMREYRDLAKTQDEKTHTVKPSDAKPELVGRWAEEAVRRDMRRKGIREREHYYGAAERRETGEIDRTYEVRPQDSGKDSLRRRPRRPGRGKAR
jgi:hypothetical protein